jgi:hypothetical protein
MGGVLCLAEDLLVSQEGLHFMELVNYLVGCLVGCFVHQSGRWVGR